MVAAGALTMDAKDREVGTYPLSLSVSVSVSGESTNTYFPEVFEDLNAVMYVKHMG